MVASCEAIGQRSETVRRANLSAIVRELHDGGPLSRSELVARTGLTRSAIRGLIGELAAADLASEERAEPHGHARPPIAARRTRPQRRGRPGPRDRGRLAGCRGGRPGRHGLRPRARRSTRRPHHRRRRSSTDLADAGRRDSRRTGRRPSDLIGVGVAVVGVVRRSDGFVSMAPNLGWRDEPLGPALAGALGIRRPGLRRQRRRPRGARRDSAAVRRTGCDDVLFISGEVGVGGGLIVDGRPLTGAAGYGGEVGHMPVNPERVACRCGSTGCWETEVGEAALLRLAGRPPRWRPARGRRVAARRRRRRPAALSALDHVGRWLGIGLAGLVNIFNPRADRARRTVRADPPVRAGDDRTGARPPGARSATTRSFGSFRPCSGSTRRCSVRRSSRSSLFLPTRRPGWSRDGLRPIGDRMIDGGPKRSARGRANGRRALRVVSSSATERVVA